MKELLTQHPWAFALIVATSGALMICIIALIMTYRRNRVFVRPPLTREDIKFINEYYDDDDKTSLLSDDERKLIEDYKTEMNERDKSKRF